MIHNDDVTENDIDIKCTQAGEKNFFTKEGRDEDDDEADEMEEENEKMVWVLWWIERKY